MTVTTPTADEVVKFVLANRPQQPSAKNIKYDVQEQQSVPCSHNKEIVNGRWGCLDCYKEIREKEDVLFKEMTEEDRDAQLKEKLEHNKHCWEQLGDRNPGVDFEQYHKRWAKIKRDSGYKGDWVSYVRFDPEFKKVNIRDHYHDDVPCPQGRKINGARLCKQHWKQNMQDNGDLANVRHEQRHEECTRIREIAKKMMGGFAENCDHIHPWTTFNELGVEFDHAFPPPENGFHGWEVKPEEKAIPGEEETPKEEASPKEKASTRILKKVTNAFSSK